MGKSIRMKIQYIYQSDSLIKVNYSIFKKIFNTAEQSSLSHMFIFIFHDRKVQIILDISYELSEEQIKY